VIDPTFIEDVFARFGKITIRRMFGEQGIYAGDVMFALGHDDAVYIKTDEAMRAELAAQGSAPFVFQMASKPQPTTTGYWRLPDSALDDPDEAAGWAKRALAVARAGKKPAPKQRGTSTRR
jgi:DNA transformation protein and related proteins